MIKHHKTTFDVNYSKQMSVIFIFRANYFYSGKPILDECSVFNPGGGGTLGISGLGCAAGTLEHLTYTRATVVQLNFATLF